MSRSVQGWNCDLVMQVIKLFVFRPKVLFSVGWHSETDWGDHLIKWTKHPSLKTEMGAANRLRVWMKGTRIRVYLNGVMAASLQDDRYPSGLTRVVVFPGKDAEIEVVFSALQLREAI